MNNDKIESMLVSMDKKFDTMMINIYEKINTMDEKINSVEKRLHDGFERVDERFEKVDERLDNVEGCLDNVDRRLTNIELTLENDIRRDIQLLFEGHSIVNRKLDEITSVKDDHEFTKIRLDVLESRVNRLEEKVS